MQQEDEDDAEKPTISYISDKRTSRQSSKIFSIDEDIHLSDDNHSMMSSHINHASNDDGEEMILTAAKLTPLLISSSSNDNKSFVSIDDTSRC